MLLLVPRLRRFLADEEVRWVSQRSLTATLHLREHRFGDTLVEDASHQRCRRRYPAVVARARLLSQLHL